MVAPLRSNKKDQRTFADVIKQNKKMIPRTNKNGEVEPPCPKEEGHIRIILQNTNTFQIQIQIDTYNELRRIHKLETDISLLNEVNYNTRKTDTYEPM